MSHPICINKLTVDEQIMEVEENRKWLQELTGQRVYKFCGNEVVSDVQV